MKCLKNVCLAVFFILVTVSMADAGHSNFCKRFKLKPIRHQTCDTELPLVYSDAFNQFDPEYWFVEKGRVKVNRNGRLKMHRATVLSRDYLDQNLTRFRVILRFQSPRWRQPKFSIHFATGEELLFSYQKIKIQKRRWRTITRKRFSATAWPAIADAPVALYANSRWKTLLVEYDYDTGMVYLDVNNDCEMDHALQWEPNLQFSHVAGSNQKWDLFELYAEQEQVAEEPGGFPVYQAEWNNIGDGSAGLAVDSSNRVYVSSTIDGNVKVFHEDGTLLSVWPDFVDPRGIAIDHNDWIYIADAGTNTIHRYNDQGEKVSELSRSGAGYESLSSVQDVAVDSQGIIYVPSFNVWFEAGIVMGVKIFKFTPDWEYIGVIVPGLETSLTGLDLDAGGNLYLTSRDGIRAFDPDGNELMMVGSVTGGSAPGEFAEGSHDVAVNEDGLMFATDQGGNNRIQVFGPDGEYRFELGGTGSEPGEFLEPGRITVKGHDIYVLDRGNNRVQKFR